MNVKSFTSLRGVACLAVVGTHVWTIFDLRRLIVERYGPGSLEEFISSLVDRTLNGQAAVELFFVLSGCVLALSLQTASGTADRSWIKAFYVKRFFRIYPALWVSIALTLCLWPLIRMGLASPAYSTWALDAYPSEITARSVMLSLAAIYVHLNWPMWTLRVELFYSILFPAIFLMVTNERTRGPFMILIALLALLPIPRNLSLHYSLAFSLGALIPSSRGIGNAHYRLIGLGLIPVLMYFRVALETSVGLKNIETLEILIAAVIVYCLYHNKKRMPLLDGRFFGYIGKISYSVYVLHFPIVFGIAAVMVAVFGTAAIQHNPLLMASLLGVLTLLLTAPLSMVANRFVEDGGNALGKRLATWKYGRSPERISADPRLQR
ncbi:acyltransferase [bacterium M00.F.Ca.ET.228.01.1.1]|uniref:acyltransferase family protein n=2 Tax=Pseudomonadota TaxID=1224 RepID=UPI00109248F1|nr:acyltransferase [Paraburkholderia phenoliruptrix]TGP46136.1 acyltransferase [bacterium M00.F.Ca.ET.228.01.1.1]TGS03951.1 acyltransferase [bacterium M00.F.Ca.ET.191.01.1.1]TGU07429.1 acyltransferase [bacterium M00.F.Ca.ET.155.01.1.1]MBW0446682.1 acyltransferase [Paraburkholderia phenoliruptrix]MBW9096891.1 acyltransferase [Paraburkholderia phenoliruptrix]